MKRRFLFVAGALLTLASFASAVQAQRVWTPQIMSLPPMSSTGSYDNGVAHGIWGGGGTTALGFPVGAVGSARFSSIFSSVPRYEALLWNATGGTPIRLHRTGFRHTYAMKGTSSKQVGYGETTGRVSMALLWSGSAASMVNLHPAGFSSSYAYGVSGNTQVGHGTAGGIQQALLWSGSAASVVSLHPFWCVSSAALAASGGNQIGFGMLPNGEAHALLWSGSAASVIDLNPPGYTSVAWDASSSQQVGTGYLFDESTFTLFFRAFRWTGSAASAVNLHPAGFDSSEALACASRRVLGFTYREQVGWGQPTGEANHHALAWSDSAESVIDLHPSLASLPIAFVKSKATGISADGREIVGTAWDADGNSYPIVWR